MILPRPAIVLSFIILANYSRAQDSVTGPHVDATVAPLPSPGATVAAISSSPAPRENPPQILPDLQDSGPLASPTVPPSLPGVQQLDDAFHRSSLGQAADEARLHGQWRALVNRTINEADLVAERAEAEAAHTDLEKRERLRSYYMNFFGRMKARAASDDLRNYLQARENEHIALLAQPRVRPETAAFSGPAAMPAKKKKKHEKAPEPALPH